MENPVASNDELLSQYVQEFESAEQETQSAREKAERDRDYYDEKQLTADEIAELKRRGQPVVISNRIKRKVNSLMGLEKQTRKDPKAFPRNPDDEQSAAAATDAIRYVCEDSRWDDKRSECAKELAVEGTAAAFVGLKKTKGGTDPDIRRIAWDRLYYDPHASEFDFADAGYMGIVIWMDLAQAVRKYPDAKDILETTWASAANADTYDDKPKHQMWADHKRRRVRICEHYCLSDEGWTFSMFTKGGFVVAPQPSPYLDEDGQPENPIKAVSLYIDRENNRYGEVRTMIGPQDEVNKRRSKALHLISQRQVRVSPNVASDPEDVRKELSKPDGVFVGEAGDVEILPTNDMAAGNLQLLQEAKAEIDLLGPNAALAGKNEQQQSGRAILAQQQGGMTEAATYLDRLKVLSLAVYRSVWSRIRQCWTEERWIRVTDDERNMRFVGLNRPMTALQQQAQQMGVTKDNLQQMMQENPEAVQQLQAMAQDPAAHQVVGHENAVAELDVDIIVDEGIDTPTIAAEQFDALIKLASTGMVKIGGDVLIEASSLRNKDKLMKMQQEEPSPEQQEAGQIAKAAEISKIRKTDSETEENIAQTEKLRVETTTGAFTAGHQVGVAA